MSRKPPKLVPIEGKSTPTSSKVSECMPSLKQGGNNVNSDAPSASVPTPRRSAPTRHFLNCNGSATTNRRRFPTTKLPLPSPGRSSPAAASGPFNSAASTSNGCSTNDDDVTSKSSTDKPVNGTLSNGVTSTKPKPSESPKLLKRQRSLGAPVTTDSDSQNSKSITNGQEAELDSRNNSVSSVSQNIASVGKRTSRHSQSSVVTPSKVTPCAPPSSTTEEQNMPALEAYEAPSVHSKVTTPLEGSDLDRLEDDALESASEPKIIRKGDTVIKSYVDEKTGKITVFEKGMKLEVCDFGSGTWYPANVKNIDWDQHQILVHYSNWSARFDEWISMKSNRVRPSKNTNVVRLQFEVGERVEAVWPMDSKKYMGTITQILPQDMYDLTFDDGIKLKRSANQIFKVSECDPPPMLVTCQSEDKPIQESTTKENSNQQKVKRIRRGSRIQTPARAPSSKAPPSPVIDNLPLEQPGPTDGSRPTHFSVFDVPQGELGKRRRTVHDYSALVKGRAAGPTGMNTKTHSRRPKSEGSTGTVQLNDAESPVPESDVANSTHNSPETNSETLKRRRKSGTQVPTTVQPLSEPNNELVTEEQVSEPNKIEPSESIPNKKRKHPPSTSNTSVSTNSNTAEGAVTSPKAETTHVVTPIATPTSAISRRAKSIGSQHTNAGTPTLFPVFQADVPKDTKEDSGFIDESGIPVIIEQADDGFWKCPRKDCGKNFRKDSLLKMHFKHYHPELKVTRGIANVVQMAQARTAFGDDPSEHFTWPKISHSEHSVATESTTNTESAVDAGCQVHTSNTIEAPSSPPKRTSSKHSHLLKESSTDKASPITSVKLDKDVSLKDVVAGETTETSDNLKALKSLPRLRLSRKRTFMTRISRIRTTGKINSRTRTPCIRNDVVDESTNVCIKKQKLSADVSDVHPIDTVNGDSVFSTPDTVKGCLETKTVSPTLSTTTTNQQSDQLAVESCLGASAGPIGVPTCESDNLPVSGRKQPRDRWSKSKSHIRRGLMSSNIRRVGTNKLQTSTSLLLKKRIQLRKYINKRGRQRRTSVLSRISSGRMRVILESLNQRSLKRKRFKAVRRCRDVKVDVINCICNNKTEFGLMIQCEHCLCWQHGSCFNVQSNSQLPEFYACQSCAEPQNIRFSRKFEWGESEFYKLGKLPSFPFAPHFPKEDARIMKQCTNLTANLMETFSMIKGLKQKERICFGSPEHPQLYQWNTERAPPQEDIQRDRFKKYFKPVLRRLIMDHKSDSSYPVKLKKLAEGRIRLRKYSDAVESARSTLKKKLGCRAAAFLEHICDSLLHDMVRAKRATSDDTSGTNKETVDVNRRFRAEQAYSRLRKMMDEIEKNQSHRGTKSNTEDSLPGLDSERRTSSPFVTSPVKNENMYTTNTIPKASHLHSSNIAISMKSSTSQPSNGMKKDIASTVKDLCELRKYLKESRTVEDNISLLLARMAKEFPEEWKNLIKMSKSFVDERRDKLHRAKLTWISNVIVTYNSLRVLLKQIYSEDNPVKQRAFCSDFEKATIRLFDLFGIGLTEERLEARKQLHPAMFRTKTVRGLQTLEMFNQASNGEDKSSILGAAQKTKLMPLKPNAELDDARKEILKRLGSSTKPLSGKDVEDLLSTASETRRLEDEGVYMNTLSTLMLGLPTRTSNSNAVNMDSSETKAKDSSLDASFSARNDYDQKALELCGQIQLLEAVRNASDIPEDESTEVTLTLSPKDSAESSETSSTGIIPVPCVPRITPDTCKKNLVRDILLQQQQIDVYLDKIEGQVIKLHGQSRSRGLISSLKASQLSSQRDKLLQSLDLVLRLSKTVIGENDVTEPDLTEFTGSEFSSSDLSDMDSSLASDDDNTSFSGTDTETADEGDSGEDLLDV